MEVADGIFICPYYGQLSTKIQNKGFGLPCHWKIRGIRCDAPRAIRQKKPTGDAVGFSEKRCKARSIIRRAPCPG
jgi:hypothetical protein